MTNILISSIVFVSIITFVVFLLIKFSKLTKYNAVIYVFLFSSWFVMYLFKVNTNLSDKGILKNWWIWAIIVSLYQFTQAVARVPLGILSQKLKSRKKVVLIVMLAMLFGLALVITSNFSDWSIIVAVIATGVVGATFGLDSQYFSENWDIKQGFISAAIVFTIPVAAKALATIISSSFAEGNINLYWVTLASMIIGTLGVVGFAFFKERTETIMLDNVDPNAKKFAKQKTMKDVFAISIAAALIAGAYTFVTTFSSVYITNSGRTWILTLISFASLISSVVTAFVFVKFFNAVLVKNIGLALVMSSVIALGISLMSGYMSESLWITLITLSSVGFGTYIMTMFGTTLHFDHKYPALVMGIFLSVKSFAKGLGGLTGKVTFNTSSSSLIAGIAILSVVVVSFIVSELIMHYSFRRDHKDNNVNSLIEDASEFEINSNKIVDSK